MNEQQKMIVFPEKQMSVNQHEHSRMLATMTIVIALLLLTTAAATAGSIQLSDEAASAGPDIYLRDVADLSGDDAASLGNAIIGSFDEGKGTITLSRDQIKEAINESHDVNWARLNFGGFGKCTVHRHLNNDDAAANKPLDVDDVEETDSAMVILANPDKPVSIELPLTIRDRVERFIMQYSAITVENLVVEYSENDLDTIARSAAEGRWEVAPLPGNASKLGRIPLTIRQYTNDGELMDSLRLTVNVARRANVVVLKSTVQRGRMFTRDMLEVRDDLIRDDRVTYPETIEEVLGMTAAGVVRAKTVINSNHLQKPLLVKRGSLINVYAIAGTLAVHDFARAKEDGIRGQIIEVRSERSRDSFYVRVTGPNEGKVVSDLSQVAKERGEQS